MTLLGTRLPGTLHTVPTLAAHILKLEHSIPSLIESSPQPDDVGGCVSPILQVIKWRLTQMKGLAPKPIALK